MTTIGDLKNENGESIIKSKMIHEIDDWDESFNAGVASCGGIEITEALHRAGWYKKSYTEENPPCVACGCRW